MPRARLPRSQGAICILARTGQMQAEDGWTRLAIRVIFAWDRFTACLACSRVARMSWTVPGRAGDAHTPVGRRGLR